MIKKIIKRLKCKHDNLKTITNIHGDAINIFNSRSWKVCKDCGKHIWSKKLDKKCLKVNMFYQGANKYDTL